MFQLTDKDVVYSYMPLYHTSGHLSTSGALFAGTKTIIKKKFSASQFWKDCVKHDVTVGARLAITIYQACSIYYISNNHIIVINR